MIRSTWGQRLHEVFEGIDDPRWDGGDAAHPLMVRSPRYEPMRKISNPARRSSERVGRLLAKRPLMAATRTRRAARRDPRGASASFSLTPLLAPTDAAGAP